MIFNIILILVLALVAYIHLVQGLLGATISAISAVIAALLAISYHEQLAHLMVKSFPNFALALSLALIFAVGYVVPRVIFDAAVPGNIRFPLMVDRVGSVLMGGVAGFFASGIIAIAAQTMPFGPSIGGYSQAELTDTRSGIVVPGGGRGGGGLDDYVNDELVSDNLTDTEHSSHLWLNQDNALLAIMQAVSNGGALSGSTSWTDVHPNYPLELFGNRLGVQPGSLHGAVALKPNLIKVGGVWKIDSRKTVDGEMKEIRPPGYQRPKIPTNSPTKILIGVSVDLSAAGMGDGDSLIRLSPASVRLDAGGQDYFAIGTMTQNYVLVQNRPDDPLIIPPGSHLVTFAFVVDPSIFSSGTTKPPLKMADNSFIEIKHFASGDLSGLKVGDVPPSGALTADGGVTRKDAVQIMISKASGGAVEGS